MDSKILVLAFLATSIITGCKNEGQKPSRKDIVDIVFASGNVVTENQYFVTAQSQGYIKKSFVKEGDTVKAGQQLFQVYDEPEKAQLESAHATYNNAVYNRGANSPVMQQLFSQKIQATNTLMNDSVNFERYKNLMASGAVSKADYDRAKLLYDNARSDFINICNNIISTQNNLELEVVKARANLIMQQNTSNFYSINSDVNGVLLQKLKNDGELVKIGETIAEIGSGDYVAKLEVAEDDINRVSRNQQVFIELNSDKNNSYPAKVTRVYPAFDTKEQSFIVEAKFSKNIPSLKPGTQLQANIIVRKKKEALVVPSSYVLPNNYVMEKGKEEKTKITTGIRTIEWTEVLSGIDEKSVLVMPK